MSEPLPLAYGPHNIRNLCDHLATVDSDFHQIISHIGYPTILQRSANFPALVRLILEQQVSLLSAKAAYLKLEVAVRDITPENILRLTDEALRACYFSRQKAAYVRSLASAVLSRTLNLETLADLPDDEIRRQLVQIKGIGLWTADNFLLLCLRRVDVFPIGDIALVNSFRKIKRNPKAPQVQILRIAETWRPYRSIATQLFWHAYLHERKVNVSLLDY